MISDEVAVAALLQNTFGVAVVALIVTWGRALLGVREALLAGWWLALDPLELVQSSILLTEIPFSLLILLATFAAAKAIGAGRGSLGWWAIVGGLLGFATLVRPISYYLPVIVCPMVALGLHARLGWRGALVRAGAVLATFALFVAPWVARNEVVSGVRTISTIQGVNLAHYRAAGALVESEGVALPTARERIHAMVDARFPPGADPALRSSIQEEIGVDLILEHPVGYTVSALKGAARTLVGPGSADLDARFGDLPGGRSLFTALWALSAASAILSALLVFAGLALLAKRRDWLLLALLATPILYLLIVGSGLEAYSRFRLQMLPSMLAASAVSVIALYDRARARLHVPPLPAPVESGAEL
jgi:4-amino-4-deoxy-L-arabinose transferase-like glycosyltransferase